MARWRLLLGFALLLVLCVWPGRAIALAVLEAYRSPLGEPRWVSVNPTDGSCWLAADSGVFHIAADGAILSHDRGFVEPHAVAVNPADGSCWVLEGSECRRSAASLEGALARLDDTGAELLRMPLTVGSWLCCPGPAPGVNPADGSCWVGERFTGRLLHLAQDGTEIWRGSDLWAGAVSVNPTDGSCWVADSWSRELVHLAEDGTELWRGLWLDFPQSVSVNPTDGSCWVVGALGGTIVHLAEDGAELLTVGGFDGRVSVAVNPADGSCWIADTTRGAVVHLAEDGAELWRDDTFVAPTSVCVNPTDGSCWVADSAQVVHLNQHGAVLWRMEGFGGPVDVSVDASDGSCWVGDQLYYDIGTGQVARLAEDGSELWRQASRTLSAMSANPSDGSCWVGHTSRYLFDDWSGMVRHLDSDGAELWRGTEFSEVASLSANSSDGSCWVATDNVAHLAEDGTDLWRGHGLGQVVSVSVNSSNGSCWVVDREDRHVARLAEDGSELWRVTESNTPLSASTNSTDSSCWATICNGRADGSTAGEVVHLAEDGSQLWRGEGPVWCGLASVNSADGSCWIAAPCDGYVALLAEDGTELWRGEDFVHPWSLSVNPTDGSCWVADYGTSQVVHLVARHFRDVPEDFWACDEIGACAGAGIVSGYEDGTYDPSGDVDRAQMAVYIARALAGGDENIPEGPRPRSFADVPPTHWAFDHIEYAKGAGVVTGYVGGLYAPDLSVLRDQMAVYIARASGWMSVGDGMGGAPELFPDVPAGHWAGAAIQECLDRGVVQGHEDGLYHPDEVITRAQMAVYVARAFGLVP